MPSAILLMAHGSRRPEANQELVELADRMRNRIDGAIIRYSYLELADPSIPDGLELCIQDGATDIRMLPYFLSAGNHVSSDLKRFRDEFQQQHPKVPCTLCPPLGLHDGVLNALISRLDEELK